MCICWYIQLIIINYACLLSWETSNYSNDKDHLLWGLSSVFPWNMSRSSAREYLEHIRRLEVKSWTPDNAHSFPHSTPDNAHSFPHSTTRGEFINTFFCISLTMETENSRVSEIRIWHKSISTLVCHLNNRAVTLGQWECTLITYIAMSLILYPLDRYRTCSCGMKSEGRCLSNKGPNTLFAKYTSI
jgi:hypothetical protein